MRKEAIREQLHQYIDIADDKKVEAIYTLRQNDIEHKYSYSAEEIGILHERAEKYLKGEGKTYSVEEAHNETVNKRKK